MAKKRREAYPGGRETFDRHQDSLSFGQCLDEVGGGRDRRGKPVAQPPDLSLGRENGPIRVDRSIGDEVSVPVRAPVAKLCFGD